MRNLDLVIENYKRLTTAELVQIAADPASLEIEIIPHLQAELLNRDKKEEALNLSSYLVRKPASYKNFSKEELADMIKERIDSGEPLESIKIDLEEKGVNFFDTINNESNLKDKQFDYLVSLKEENLDESAINEKMKATFNLTEEETDLAKRQLRNKGMQNLVIGYSSVIVSVILILIFLEAGGSIGFGAVLFLVLGIWRIFEGHRQRK